MYTTQAINRNHLQQLVNFKTFIEMWVKMIDVHEQNVIKNMRVLQTNCTILESKRMIALQFI
jgi:hypothetical protein